jgi:surfeit locus 1 family protein
MDEPLPALPEVPEEQRDEYRLVRLTGEIGRGELHVLTSTREAGPGYLVIAPLRLADGREVLLQRGFVPEAAKDAARPGGPVTIEGNLLWPDDRNRFTPEPNRARNIWFARAVAPMAAALGTEPVLVVARSATGGGVEAVPVTVAIPNDHLQYALTWFGLAAVWAAMTGWFLRAGRRADQGRSPAKALESGRGGD